MESNRLHTKSIARFCDYISSETGEYVWKWILEVLDGGGKNMKMGE